MSSEDPAHLVRRILGVLVAMVFHRWRIAVAPLVPRSARVAPVDIPQDVVLTLRDQDGVISRRQATAAGLTKSDIDRLVRRRLWARMLPGLFVDHTGEPTWLQRAWGGVLHYAPAAVAGPSALRLIAGPGWRQYDDTAPIAIAVAEHRNVKSLPGYRIQYVADFERRVLATVQPPRVRFEEACLDLVAATRSELDRIQILAAACQSRRTTAARLREALTQRKRTAGRRFLEAVLGDIADGTCSVLEHGYLTKVERPHGLPRGRRQTPDATRSGKVYRDVSYPEYDQYVELDGFVHHGSAEARDHDLERDLDAALTGQATVRLGWGQVFGRPCRTAAKIGLLLRAKGWKGAVTACGHACAAFS